MRNLQKQKQKWDENKIDLKKFKNKKRYDCNIVAREWRSHNCSVYCSVLFPSSNRINSNKLLITTLDKPKDQEPHKFSSKIDNCVLVNSWMDIDEAPSMMRIDINNNRKSFSFSFQTTAGHCQRHFIILIFSSFDFSFTFYVYNSIPFTKNRCEQ